MTAVGVLMKYEGVYLEMEKLTVTDINAHQAAILDMTAADISTEFCFITNTCNPVVKVIDSSFTNVVSQMKSTLFNIDLTK